MFKFGKYMLNRTNNSIELVCWIYCNKGANSKMLGESTIANFYHGQYLNYLYFSARYVSPINKKKPRQAPMVY